MAQTFFPITPTEITPANPNAWETMDASALIAVGATGVILHVVNTQSGAYRNIGLRKNGSTDERTIDMYIINHWWAMIGVDASRIFEAYVENTTDIDIYVVGYTMSGVTFATNATEKSPGASGGWTAVDCSTEAPNAIGLIFEVQNTYSANYMFGLRKNGSSDDRYADIYKHSCFGAVIGCDASQIYEGYAESAFYIDFFLVGYITDGCTFNTNATDVSLGSTGSWLDLSALPSGANMGFIEVHSVTTNLYFGLRKNGTAEDIYYWTVGQSWGIVECDVSQVIEGKIENLAIDFFVVGYSEIPAAVGLENKSANMGAKMIAGKLI